MAPMHISSWLERCRREFSHVGINIMGTADGAPWQHILPGCQAVVVFASGGKALWEAFVADCREQPDHLRDEAHPLDTFVERTLLRTDPNPARSQRWIRCAATEPTEVDFRTLGLQAGLGHHSLLGLLLNPSFGPWMGIRLACFTTDALPIQGPLAQHSPCSTCSAPCMSACPAAAVSRVGWDLQRCSTFHFESSICESSCEARRACPEGGNHQYSDLQMHYHYNQQTGRSALAKQLSIDAPGLGDAPKWKDWRKG